MLVLHSLWNAIFQHNATKSYARSAPPNRLLPVSFCTVCCRYVDFVIWALVGRSCDGSTECSTSQSDSRSLSTSFPLWGPIIPKRRDRPAGFNVSTEEQLAESVSLLVLHIPVVLRIHVHCISLV